MLDMPFHTATSTLLPAPKVGEASGSTFDALVEVVSNNQGNDPSAVSNR